MRIVRSSKRGFTLVELMLALAIITIIGWTTVALMIAIKDSFMTTYNVNDSADYALLYANGFENAFLAATQNQENGIFRIREDDSVLCRNKDTGDVFNPLQMKTIRQKDGQKVDKWIVRMYFKTDTTSASQVVKYKIFLLDNYYSPNLKVMNVYEGSIWPPHIGFNKIKLSKLGDYTKDAGHKFVNDNYNILSDGWFDTIEYKFK